MGIPFSNEGHQTFCQMMEIGEIAELESLTLHDAEPLLDLVHPGAMYWEKVADKAGMERQPVLSLFAMMDTRIIEHKKDASNRGWKLLIELGEQRNELDLPLAHGRLSRDLACPGIKSRKQVQGPSTFVLMLYAGRQRRSRRKRRGKARTG